MYFGHFSVNTLTTNDEVLVPPKVIPSDFYNLVENERKYCNSL